MIPRWRGAVARRQARAGLPVDGREGNRVAHRGVELTPGAGVVTTRGHVHWIVTEQGAVDLHGLALRERAEALISIAHPDFRPELQRRCARSGTSAV